MAFSGVINTVTETADQVAQAAGEAARDATQTATQAANQAGQQIDNTFDQVGQAAASAVDDTVSAGQDFVDDTVDEAESQFGQVTQEAQDVADQTVSGAQDAVSDAQQGTQDTVQQAQEASTQFGQTLSDTGQEVIDQVDFPQPDDLIYDIEALSLSASAEVTDSSVNLTTRTGGRILVRFGPQFLPAEVTAREAAQAVGVPNAVEGFAKVQIEVQPQRPVELRNQLQQHYGRINELVNNIPSQVAGVSGIPATATGFSLPNRLSNPFSYEVQMPVDFFGETLFASGDTQVDTKNIPFNKPVIPELPDLGVTVGQLPPIRIKFNATPVPDLVPFIDEGNVVLNEATVEIPPSQLFETVDISQGSCGNLYPDIGDRVSSIESEIASLARQATDDISDVVSGASSPKEELRALANSSTSLRDRVAVTPQELSNQGTNLNQLRSNASNLLQNINDNVQVPSCIQDLSSRLDNALSTVNEIADGAVRQGEVPCSETFSDISSSIKSLSDRFRSADTPSPSSLLQELGSKEEVGSQVGSAIEEFSSIEQEARSLRGEVESRVRSERPNCADRFLSQLDSITSNSQQVRSSLEQALNNLPSPEQRGTEVPTGGSLGCSDISSTIRNKVENSTSAADQITNRSPSNTARERASQEMDQIESLASRIQTEVPDENPCKSRLLSRLSSAREQLRAFTSQESAPPSCERKYPDVAGRVDNFEQKILDVSPPVNAQQIQDFSRQADEITEVIENEIPPSDPCQRRLAEQTEELLRRVSNLRPEIRINLPSESDGESSSQDQFLQQLISRLRTQQEEAPGQTLSDSIRSGIDQDTSSNIEIGQEGSDRSSVSGPDLDEV